MLKERAILILLVCSLFILLAGCLESTTEVTQTFATTRPSLQTMTSATVNLPTATNTPSIAPERDPVDGYLLAIDFLMKGAGHMSSGITYLAIDTTEMAHLTAENKSRFFKALEKYRLILLDKTKKELDTEGYIQNTIFEKGLLIKITDKPKPYFTATAMLMDVMILRSGLEAYGAQDLKIYFRNGEWQLTLTGPTIIA